MKRMTHDEYVERLKAIHDNIEVLEEFKNTQTSIFHRCKIHNYEWMVLPNNLLRGKNCPKCSGVYRKTHDEYVEEVKSLRDNIEVLGMYKNNKTKILHKCNIHNYEWYVSPTILLSGSNCPKCSKQYRRSHDDYVAELKIKNPNLEVIGVYVDIDTKILHRCKTHDCVFEKFPSSALRGEGCVKCGHDKLASQFVKTHEQYVKELNDINSNIEVIGEYENSKTKILHRCKLDNYEWYTTPDNVLRSCGCPKCIISKGELKISKWLDGRNILYETQKRFDDCKDIRSLPFDFYIPIINTCIEYDGIQHFEPIDFAGRGQEWAIEHFKSTQERDKIKTEYCKNNGIKLIRIPYYKDIESELNLLFA